MKISIIIPALNEARQLPATLSAIKNLNGHFEVIVADGGSDDATARLAEAAGCKVVAAPKSCAAQMNAGANAASGEVLLFLHADTVLPKNAYDLIEKALENPETAAGCFRLAFDNPHPVLRVSAFCTRFRFPLSHYGDSAYFVRKEVFHALSGFSEMPILEDLDFWLRLNRRFKTKVLEASVVTSARRFERYGVVKEQGLSVAVVLFYKLGFDIDWIHRFYNKNKTVAQRKPNAGWYKLKYPFITAWHWLYSNLHLALQTYHVFDFMFLHKIGANQLCANHAWLNGVVPETQDFVWEKNIVFASPRKQNWLVEPEDDALIVTRIGKFLAAMVRRSNTNNGEMPQGKKRRMPHAVNFIHGSIHYNGGFLLFNDMKDAMLHFSDSRFVKEFKRFASTEKRELTVLLRERAYDPEEYAWFVTFIRAHIPWYANGNGPTKKRVLYGTPSPYPAVNPINGSWAVDLMDLYRGHVDKIVRPPLERGKYFNGVYQGCQQEFTFMERFHAWGQHLIIKAKGFQGNLVFTHRKKIEPENWAHYRGTNGNWSASYPVSHPFMSIEKARAKRSLEKNYVAEMELA